MSNQPKHTPGDWTAVRSGGIGYFEWFVRIDGESRAIASDIIDPETGQPSEANARLIAAAPDLLDFVRLVIRGLNSGAIKARPIMDMDPNADEIKTKSIAAIAVSLIAKAEGRGK